MKSFKQRVSHAIDVIVNERITTRKFNSNFEMHDAEEIVTALYRRAQKNSKLKKNLFKYIHEGSCLEAVEKLEDVQDLESHSENSRYKKDIENFLKTLDILN